MFKACNRTYFEIGDKVTQRAYAGYDATVIEVISMGNEADSHYRVLIDTNNKEQFFDENGEVEANVTALISWEELARYNDAPELVAVAEKAFIVTMRDCETKRVAYEARIEASDEGQAKRRAFEYAAQAGVNIDEVVVKVR